MYGDFSRDSFDSNKHYTRVLMQQGRPLTDADWNEMVELLVREQRELVKSIIGWHGSSDVGFDRREEDKKLVLEAGTYYVDGILCRNECNPVITIPELKDPDKKHLIYLDAWEESVSSVDDPHLLEPALNGIETATRSRVCWAVRVSESVLEEKKPFINREALIKAIIGDTKINAEKLPQLEVMIDSNRRNPDLRNQSPCELPDIAKQGKELLYRIEIHDSGTPASPKDAKTPTFKWSRDNGDTVVPLQSVATGGSGETNLVFANPGGAVRQRRERLRKGAWVELYDQWGVSRNLFKIKDVKASLVTVNSKPNDIDPKILARSTPLRCHSAFVRQWDQGANEVKVGALPCSVSANEGWIEIEHGLKVRFQGGNYCLEGDYWLIRTTSDGRVLVTDPSPDDCTDATVKNSVARRRHHYAPLGYVIKVGNDNKVETPFRNAGPKKVLFDSIGVPDPDRKNIDGCLGAPPVLALKPENKQPEAQPKSDLPPICAAPIESRPPINPVSLLSGEGARALKGYLSSPKDVTRRVPARYLNYEPQSDGYRRFRSPLLVSEILESSFEKYLAKVERCIDVSEAERERVEADARADYALAAEFQSLVSSGQGFRPLIA